MKTIFSSFTAEARVAVVAVSALLCAGFVSCSNDDEESSGDSVPAELIGTWNVDEGYTITFNKNGKGYIEGYFDNEDEDDDEYESAVRKLITRAVSTQRINFTYTYDATLRKLTLSAQGETNVFIIQSISATHLVLVDEDGDELTASKSNGSSTEETTVDMSKIYGTWELYTMTIKFSKDPDVCTIAYSDGTTQSSTFTISGNVIYFTEGGHLTVTNVTDTQLTVSDLRIDDKPTTVTFSRKSDTENTVGDISLLVNKTWANAGDQDNNQFRFNSDGTCTIIDEGDTINFEWTYNADTHEITLSSNGESLVMTIIKLTKDTLILSIPAEGEIVLVAVD